ncbi:hypothetical protein [Nocardia terpenica]|uniref:hypothetical protein n=1 Tax=Nocardia terpenica TaxID=455432 RepID=UPI0002E485E3|nr:hypothetical protein [Nocardia terpenica]
MTRGPADRQKPTAGTALAIPPLAELRERRSAKWRTFAVDVLPLLMAEMDLPLAEPVVREAVERSDTGYAAPTFDLADTVRGYAERAWGWRIYAGQMRMFATDPDRGRAPHCRRPLTRQRPTIDPEQET